MTTESKKAQSPSEAADWRMVDEHVQRQGLPRDVVEALRRIRDPEARAKFDKENEEEAKATAAAKAKGAKADDKPEPKAEHAERRGVLHR